MARGMNSSRWNGRKAGLAGLLALALLFGSMTAGPSAHADGPAAVFYGYVSAEQGGVLPERVRAVSEHGAVCGSANVVPTASGVAGFYAVIVVSGSAKDGCPITGEVVHFALVYGLIDEGFAVGAPASFRSGEVTQLHLIRTAANTFGAALHLP